MLIIMEHRDVHLFLEPAFDLETLGRLDIFKVDAAKGRLQAGNGIDEGVGILAGDFDIKAVDAGELLEQDAFAFHHRFRCE